jgi:hypothetical protein
MSIAGALADARKSATRMYINNFADKGRQNTIDMLLVRNGTLGLRFPHADLVLGPVDGPSSCPLVRSDK